MGNRKIFNQQKKDRHNTLTTGRCRTSPLPPPEQVPQSGLTPRRGIRPRPAHHAGRHRRRNAECTAQPIRRPRAGAHNRRRLACPQNRLGPTQPYRHKKPVPRKRTGFHISSAQLQPPCRRAGPPQPSPNSDGTYLLYRGDYIYSSDSTPTRKPPAKPASTSQPSCRPRQRRDEASSPDTMIAATMGQKSDMTPMILSMTNRAVTAPIAAR